MVEAPDDRRPEEVISYEHCGARRGFVAISLFTLAAIVTAAVFVRCEEIRLEEAPEAAV